MTLRLHWLVLVVATLLAARVEAFDDPDTEIARRHFNQGKTFYDAQDYAHALDEFEAAKRARPAPALEFNIARCHDRLENHAAAIAAYERYLAASPNATDAGEVRDRVARLRARQAEIEAHTEKPSLLPPPSFDSNSRAPELVFTPPPSPPPERKSHRNLAIVLGVVGGVVLVAGAVTLGVLLSQPGPPSYTMSSLGTQRITP